MKKTIILLIAGLCYLVAANSQAKVVESGGESSPSSPVYLTDSEGTKHTCHLVPDSNSLLCTKQTAVEHVKNCDRWESGSNRREKCETSLHKCKSPEVWNSTLGDCHQEASQF